MTIPKVLRGAIVFAVALGLLAAAAPARGREIVVDGPGAGPGAGSDGALAAALRSAGDGDVVRVRKGVYAETLVIDKRVSLAGEAGAVLDPSHPFRPEWRSAPEVGRGVYRAAVDRRPYTLFIGGKVVAALDERRTGGDGTWSWKGLLASGPPRGGFKFVRALWVHVAADKAVYVHLADDANPATLDWSVLWSADPAIAFRSADGASVTALTVAHAWTAVSLTDHSRRCTVSACVLGPWDKDGVVAGGGTAESLVEHNDIFRGSYEDWSPVVESKDPKESMQRYEIWQVHKLAGFYDRVGVNIFRAGVGNRVRGNHIHETFDGIDLGDFAVESLDKPPADPDAGRGTEISENLIERTRDSGIELGAGCVDVRVHHNTLRQTHGGLRFKVPRVGPVFIYRNVLEGGSPFNIWYSMDDSPAEGYVYHNTIVGGSVALQYSSFGAANHAHGGAPRWHYLNNLFVTERGFFHDSRTGAPVNFTADYNVVVGGGRAWPDPAPADAVADDPAVEKEPGKDRHSRYAERVDLGPDLRPAPGSPAVDAGLDLSTYFHGKPLPGCEPGDFKGKAPDAGAFEVR